MILYFVLLAHVIKPLPLFSPQKASWIVLTTACVWGTGVETTRARWWGPWRRDSAGRLSAEQGPMDQNRGTASDRPFHQLWDLRALVASSVKIRQQQSTSRNHEDEVKPSAWKQLHFVKVTRKWKGRGHTQLVPVRLSFTEHRVRTWNPSVHFPPRTRGVGAITSFDQIGKLMSQTDMPKANVYWAATKGRTCALHYAVHSPPPPRGSSPTLQIWGGGGGQRG